MWLSMRLLFPSWQIPMSVFSRRLALAWTAWQDLELTLRVVNVSDEAYQEIAGYPAPGRRFLAGLRWRQ